MKKFLELFMLFCMFITGLGIGYLLGVKTVQDEAISRNIAEYDNNAFIWTATKND